LGAGSGSGTPLAAAVSRGAKASQGNNEKDLLFCLHFFAVI
jgi:hypothetical protein